MRSMFLLTCTMLLCLHAPAQRADSLKYCLAPDEVGVGGFDPASYFKSPKPLYGSPSISTRYDGVVYRFASQENKNDFLKNPTKYLPQFGGWCSTNLVLGRATTPTYNNFLLQEGKLYLFERTLSVNGKELWLGDPKKNEQIATMNYDKFKVTGKTK